MHWEPSTDPLGEQRVFSTSEPALERRDIPFQRYRLCCQMLSWLSHVGTSLIGCLRNCRQSPLVIRSDKWASVSLRRKWHLVSPMKCKQMYSVGLHRHLGCKGNVWIHFFPTSSRIMSKCLFTSVSEPVCPYTYWRHFTSQSNHTKAVSLFSGGRVVFTSGFDINIILARLTLWLALFIRR